MSQKLTASVYTSQVGHRLAYELWNNHFIREMLPEYRWSSNNPGDYLLRNLRGCHWVSDPSARGVIAAILRAAYTHDLGAAYSYEDERFMGDYHVLKPEGKEYIVIKLRKPKCPVTITGRANYLRRDGFSEVLFHEPDFRPAHAWAELITTQLCMRAVFGGGYGDESNQLLPLEEIQTTSLLGFKLLFDKEMQEWRVWKK